MTKHHIDTPCLLIDLDILERNLLRMADAAKMAGIRLRPHIKTHKIPEIAIRQVELSGNGIAVSKLGEAEIMVTAGIRDILIANQIIGEQKIARLAALMKRAEMAISVDSITGVEHLNRFLPSGLPTLKLLIEINTGMNRCGVSEDKEIAAIISELRQSSKLQFEGFLSHSGNIYGASNYDEMRSIAISEASQMHGLAERWRGRGVQVNCVSSGSTPASLFINEFCNVTEFRPGNYVFYDNIQISLGVASERDCALTVLAAVISTPSSDRVVIDAGSKALGLDRGAHSKQTTVGYGLVVNHPEAVIERLSEEHGILKTANASDFQIGEKLMIIPNHACAVTNLFDEVCLLRNDEVVGTRRIAARGKMQ